VEWDRLTKAGNEFFEQKLKDYTRLGMSYSNYWTNAFDDFIRYQIGSTDQGIKHCRNVENNIWKLLGKYQAYLSLEMLYILSLCCALHDCAKTGKVSNHATEGARIIQRELLKRKYVQAQATADAIAWVVSAHDSGDFSKLPEKAVGVGGDVQLRLRDCAAIFRLADMMDTCEDRAARFHKMFNLPHATLNEFVNDVRLSIQDCQCSQTDRTCIEVGAHTSDINTRRKVQTYVEGLNKDLTSQHIRLLQNLTLVYLTPKKLRREKNISLPFKFVLSWIPSFSDTLPTRTGVPLAAAKRLAVVSRPMSRLVPCYFLNTETNIDIDKELFDCLTIKRKIDPKFLYWSLRGTKAYLALVPKQAYSSFLDMPWRGDFFSAAGCPQPRMA